MLRKVSQLVVAAGIILPGLAVCGGCEREPAEAAGAKIVQLRVITPHSPIIQEAFAYGFRRWQESRKLPEIITVQWIQRGTMECLRYVCEMYEQYGEGPVSNMPLDVFFGGGVSVHREVASRGYSQPVDLPAELKAALPAELAGQPLHAHDGSWHGTALGGFGILYNRFACQARGIAPPTCWEDLARPEYAGWVAVADPETSGSTTQCLVMALLRHGWQRGWGIVSGMMANCNGVLSSSNLIAPTVAAGMTLAGLEPEFVARMTIATAPPDLLDYTNPPEATALMPDPITVLRGTGNLREATLFVEFVLSAEGQALWALPADVPGGPPAQPLFRYPIRPDVYEQYGGQFVVEGNPFKDLKSMPYDANLDKAYTTLIPPLIQAACGRQHITMQLAYRKARTSGSDGADLKTLNEPPFSHEEALRHAEAISRDPKVVAELVESWSRFFAERYRKILAGGSN